MKIQNKKIAAKKYPFNACVIGYDGEPSGGVDDDVLKAFEENLKEIKEIAKGKDLKSLEDALRVSKAKYSCNYINSLFSACTWMFPYGSEERKKLDKMYNDLTDVCRSYKRYENALQIIKNAFAQSGYKLFDENFKYGGQPQFVFTKNGLFFYVNSDRQSIFWLFRRGTHKFYVEWNDNIKDSVHNLKKISGGLDNLLKTANSIKNASKIAKKICLAYTKKDLLEFLKYKLSSDERWALRALQRIYEGQTYEELNEENTKELNNLGFTGFDAPILTSIYKSYLEHNKRLTPKQLSLVMKMMKKYAGQIYRSNYLNKTQLEKVYAEHLEKNLF